MSYNTFEALLKLHPYSSSYLTAIVKRDRPCTGLELLSYAHDIDVWLSEKCIQQATSSGFYANHYYPTYMWGREYAQVSKVSNLGYGRLFTETFKPEGSNSRNTLYKNDLGQTVYIAVEVHFKFEQDLLAFRLRWGINE